MRAELTRAFTLIELLVVMAVFAFVALLFLAGHVARSPRINCVNNLKQVGLAYRIWALDHNDKFPMQVSITNGGSLEFVDGGAAFWHFRPLSNELSSAKVMVCPADKKRKAASGFGSDFNDQHLSYFVAVDATPVNAMMFMAGDRNLTNGPPTTSHVLNLATNPLIGWTAQMHNCRGNIALADGSVQQFGTYKLRAAPGLSTNRLVMP
jgi:prepilin-type N-terminal cleavage/methylation domain-containing protein